MAKKTKSGGNPLDGSPIMVGGGSGGVRPGDKVNCKFDDNDYPEPDGTGVKRFEHPGWIMQSLEIETKKHTITFARSREANIKVNLRATKERILIYSDSSGAGVFGITFDTRVYPRDSANSHVHKDRSSVSSVNLVLDGDTFKINKPVEIRAHPGVAVIKPSRRKSNASKYRRARR